MFIVPVIARDEATIAVRVTEPPVAIYAFEVARVMLVTAGPPLPPPPSPTLPPPPQPSGIVMINAMAAKEATPFLYRRFGIHKTNNRSRPLAKVPNRHLRSDGATIAALVTCLTAATGPPLGPAVPNVKVTGTTAPLRLAVVGLNVRLMPDGKE